jgi:DNA-cytosine methyltransferase
MRHASFFSGAGGLDIGFERAGIKTVSTCEIDPYASAVLAERFPDAPNLGSITEINANDIPEADIWSGGFPCQDLSVAGKRAGFTGQRSSLAFTFLDLVEQRRPRWLVLENVPGLFSSNAGRDFARLLREMDELGYGVSWRTLDARYFGVPQRRRRVFLVASLESDRANQVLFECESCGGHPAPGKSSWQETSAGVDDGSGIAGALLARYHKGVSSTIDNHLVVGSEANADRVRTVDGLAGRLDNRQVVEDQRRVGNFELYDFPKDSVAPTLSALRAKDEMVYGPALSFPSRFGSNATVTEDVAQSFAHSAGAPAVFRKSRRAQTDQDVETWVDDGVANTINLFDLGDVRTTHAVVGTSYDGYNQRLDPDGAHRTLRTGRDSSDFVIAPVGTPDDSGADPIGLDNHRYRCCGNGVVANVAEWIGQRLVSVDKEWKNV